MDLSTLAIDPESQTAELVIVHPVTGAPLEEGGKQVIIVLHGPDSTVQKKVTRKFSNEALDRGVKKKKMNISIEMIESRSLELDVVSTADWKNFVYEGKSLECTPENVRMIYKKLPWIREQVEEFMHERANFLGE